VCASGPSTVQAPQPVSGIRPTSRKLRKDLRTLALFIDLYCRRRHRNAARAPVWLRTVDVAAVHGRPLELCPECAKLAAHAFAKRMQCPLEPKPACKHCPQHCYAPQYRAQIRDVMRYSGRRLVLGGRIYYLLRLLL
jgi:hypothetical protein